MYTIYTHIYHIYDIYATNHLQLIKECYDSSELKKATTITSLKDCNLFAVR